MIIVIRWFDCKKSDKPSCGEQFVIVVNCIYTCFHCWTSFLNFTSFSSMRCVPIRRCVHWFNRLLHRLWSSSSWNEQLILEENIYFCFPELSTREKKSSIVQPELRSSKLKHTFNWSWLLIQLIVNHYSVNWFTIAAIVNGLFQTKVFYA